MVSLEASLADATLTSGTIDILAYYSGLLLWEAQWQLCTVADGGCPVGPGSFSGRASKMVPIFAPPGLYQIDIQVHAEGEEIACLTFPLNMVPPIAADAAPDTAAVPWWEAGPPARRRRRIGGGADLPAEPAARAAAAKEEEEDEEEDGGRRGLLLAANDLAVQGALDPFNSLSFEGLLDSFGL